MITCLSCLFVSGLIYAKYVLLYKSAGYISQFVYPRKRKKGLLGDLYEFPKGTMAIGRLDVKSEGLLLLTTDGKLSEQIRSHKVEKEYHVLVRCCRTFKTGCK